MPSISATWRKPVASAGEGVRVYSGDLFDELVAPNIVAAEGFAATEKTKTLQKTRKSRRRRSIPAKRRGSSAKQVSRRAQYEDLAKRKKLQKYFEEVEAQQREHKRVLKHRMDDKQKRRDENFTKLLRTMEIESDLPHEISAYLELQDATDLRRKQQLYRSWSAEVFDPIQKQVAKQLDSVDIRVREKRNKKYFDEFLAVGNHRFISRDGVDDEYDPFQARAHHLKVHTRHLNDPVKADLRRTQAENKMFARLNPDRPVIRPRARQTVELLMWDKLDATPYGRYEGDKHSGNGKVNKSRKSNLEGVFDHYNVYKSPPREHKAKRRDDRGFNIVTNQS